MLDLMKVARDPASVHAPLARYSHQIALSGSERLLAMSGQVGIGPDGELPEGADAQFELALGNVVLNLEAAGMTLLFVPALAGPALKVEIDAWASASAADS
jgi:enamine deaminase RidA (YjgF/YER057c/UK114 family)